MTMPLRKGKQFLRSLLRVAPRPVISLCRDLTRFDDETRQRARLEWRVIADGEINKRLEMLCFLLLAISLSVRADVSQLVRSGNGFVYDVPKVTELELEVSNEFPTGEEFPQDAIPVAPSDAELGQIDVSDPEPEEPVISATSNTKSSSSVHGYKYQKPSRRFKS